MEALLPVPAAQHDGLLHAAFGPKPFGPGDGRFSSPNLLTNGADLFCGGYPTRSFGRGPVRSASPSPRAASHSRSSSDTGSVVDEGDDSPAAAEHRAHLARLAFQYQDAANRYQLCFSHLADTSDEAAALRRENDQIRFANGDLVRRISMFGGKHGSAPALALADEFRRQALAEEQAKAMPAPPLPAAMMRPVPDAMPKSISVRSTGYIKMNQSGNHRGASKSNNAGSQRVFVGMGGGAAKGEEKEGVKKEQGTGGMEFQVYNQGMFKTELCNKWEQTGACSYGDRCQFAHGVSELRPVIRHPRYKTQVCRMVLAGILCPYGHRCHFRHSLSPADSHLLHH